ncbi:unnamed protein product [Cercopithifilaria johnstoni]|uniref:Uncharacterized protein n=1 Tax=Cercopithifilaria johnstoni TaxID=2874296 RepID=A0A8J2MG98_9BILA|nr:unnamed protein product [Cercopithifilaria johnstoni]
MSLINEGAISNLSFPFLCHQLFRRRAARINGEVVVAEVSAIPLLKRERRRHQSTLFLLGNPHASCWDRTSGLLFTRQTLYH